jgi:hypothetical protein
MRGRTPTQLRARAPTAGTSRCSAMATHTPSTTADTTAAASYLASRFHCSTPEVAAVVLPAPAVASGPGAAGRLSLSRPGSLSPGDLNSCDRSRAGRDCQLRLPVFCRTLYSTSSTSHCQCPAASTSALQSTNFPPRGSASPDIELNPLRVGRYERIVMNGDARAIASICHKVVRAPPELRRGPPNGCRR